MAWRITIIISFVTLLAVFVLLFNYSLEVIKKTVLKSEAVEINEARVKRLYNTFTFEDKENLFKLPCNSGQQSSCLNILKMQQKLKDNVLGGAITEADIVTEKLFSLARAKRLDGRLAAIIQEANREGSAVFAESHLSADGGRDLVVVAIHVFDITEDQALKGVYLISYNNPKLINKVMVPYYVSLIVLFLISCSLILLYIFKTSYSFSKKFDELFEEHQRGLAEIERLKKENIQQSQFLTNFTHELRTPLNSIIGFSGLIKDETLGTVGNPEYKKFATDINNSGVHLLSLINDILDYSKAEVGRLKVNIAETDIVKLSKQCMAIVAPRASESGVDLLQSFADEHFILKVDSKRLKQVLLNLLSNSVKFTPEGGSVTISIFPDLKTNRLYIEVQDTGVGIAEKDLPTVLSLFGQAETNLSRKYEGSGIGLPFAKKLTNLMGGTFEISSKVGMGTRVTLAFPFDKRLNAEFKEGIAA